MAEPTDLSMMPPGWAEENKGPQTLIIAGTLTAVTFFFVVGRIYSRFLTAKKLGVDDYLIILSIILGLAYLGLATEAIKAGAGRHVATLTPAQIERAIFMTVVSFVPGVTSFMVPKFAVIILLVKLLNPERFHRIIMWIVSVLYLVIVAGMLTINFAQCSPAEGQWKVELVAQGKATCIDRAITVNYALMVGIYSAVLDFYLAAYPTYVLYHLQMNWKKKLALSSALGFGYCACIVTAYKCSTLLGLLHDADFIYAVDDVVLWTNIEANCVLIGACIPCMAPVITLLFGTSAFSGSTPVYSGGRKASSGAGSKGGFSLTLWTRNTKNKSSPLGSSSSPLGTQRESRDRISEERQIKSGHSDPPYIAGIQKKEEFYIEYETKPTKSQW